MVISISNFQRLKVVLNPLSNPDGLSKVHGGSFNLFLFPGRDQSGRSGQVLIRYAAIENLRPSPSVPARVIFGLHGMESTWSFNKHLHEGSSLRRRTRWVPKGRPHGTPPFTWEESAEDVLYKLKDMENWDWSNLDSMLQNIETYNGLGYQRYHKSVPSPYLWSGTTIYTRGKYVSDKKWSSMAVSKQLGVAAMLKVMQERGIK